MCFAPIYNIMNNSWMRFYLNVLVIKKKKFNPYNTTNKNCSYFFFNWELDDKHISVSSG